ncbi:glucosamine kinase [Rivibacter subsaxonicus]|uniref:Glucosamine kinase n=1 Tax=Rivibacter subsaxonicus TaxID=457575 RepID=A0A4Q7V6G1_9BURK|nr:glucosamine kinase [Rivibacter subsaxonicus]
MSRRPSPSSSTAVPAARYLIGIDGGGTGTRARLVDSAGRRLGQGEAGPSALGQGVDQAWRNIRQAIDAAFLAAGLTPAAEADCALGLGLAGAEVATRRERFLASAPAYCKLALATDAATTLAGAHAGRPGTIVAVGTGTIGLARHADGRETSANGWGFPVGDEGSGAWLGLLAMQIAQQAFDGRSAAGALARAVWRTAGGSRAELLAWCEHAGQQRYAELAPLVFETEADDTQAAALLAAAAQAIEATVVAIDPRAELPLALCGSLGRRLEPYLDAATRARCVKPAGDAIDGALQLVREQIRQPLAPGIP